MTLNQIILRELLRYAFATTEIREGSAPLTRTSEDRSRMKQKVIDTKLWLCRDVDGHWISRTRPDVDRDGGFYHFPGGNGYELCEWTIRDLGLPVCELGEAVLFRVELTYEYHLDPPDDP